MGKRNQKNLPGLEGAAQKLKTTDKALLKSKFRLGSVTRMPSFLSNLYTFTYRSITGHDSEPFVMLVQSQRTGNAFYTAGNGNRYLIGVNLNYATSPDTRNLIIDTLKNRGPIPWRQVSIVGMFVDKRIRDFFRQYNVRKLRDLSVVDATKYLEETGFFATSE